MTDILLILLLSAIVTGAGYSIYRSKKAGKKCIGCPGSGCCDRCCHEKK